MFFSPKKKDVLFTTLTDSSINVRDAAQFFYEFTENSTEPLNVLSTTIKGFETKGDNYVRSILTELDKSFITVIEREDILFLTMKMDDILDEMHHCTSCIELYEIDAHNEFIQKQAKVIFDSAVEMAEAVDVLVFKDFEKVRASAKKIKTLETEGDVILRKSIKELFRNEKNPVILLKYKEVFEILEEISDACQTVANVFESIIMKNT